MVRITRDRRFDFGKYEGFTVGEVMEKDFQYIVYMNTKIKWLFNDFEKQKIRNIQNKNKNKDIHMKNVRCRTSFEEEMYGLLNQF